MRSFVDVRSSRSLSLSFKKTNPHAQKKIICPVCAPATRHRGPRALQTVHRAQPKPSLGSLSARRSAGCVTGVRRASDSSIGPPVGLVGSIRVVSHETVTRKTRRTSLRSRERENDASRVPFSDVRTYPSAAPASGCVEAFVSFRSFPQFQFLTSPSFVLRVMTRQMYRRRDSRALFPSVDGCRFKRRRVDSRPGGAFVCLRRWRRTRRRDASW